MQIPKHPRSNILIVDDEPSIRDAIVTYLSAHNYEVQCAENGIEALDLIKSNQYDLIILDIRMPYLDGFELSQSMKDESIEIPILVISAIKSSVKLYQEVDRLIKTFDLKSLKNKVDKILNTQKSE